MWFVERKLPRISNLRTTWILGPENRSKVIATETLNFVTDAGMQILAGAGYDLDTEMQRIWKDGRLYTFGEGTNEIQRNIIAREIIG